MNELAAQLVEKHEGRRRFAYKCTQGKLTIGVGHNLEAKPLPDSVIDLLFDCDLEDAESDARQYAYFDRLNEQRQAAIIDMSFQLGKTRLAQFKKMHAALNVGDFKGASRECLDSLYATQTPSRAQRIAHIIRRGVMAWFTKLSNWCVRWWGGETWAERPAIAPDPSSGK